MFSDGAHTYVDPVKGCLDDAPVLLVKKHGRHGVMNYRVHGRRCIVDGVFATMELVAGGFRAAEGHDQEDRSMKGLQYCSQQPFCWPAVRPPASGATCRR